MSIVLYTLVLKWKTGMGGGKERKIVGMEKGPYFHGVKVCSVRKRKKEGAFMGQSKQKASRDIS